MDEMKLVYGAFESRTSVTVDGFGVIRVFGSL